MIRQGMFSTTVTSRKSTALDEAKSKRPVYDLIDRMETAEQRIIDVARANDDGNLDSAGNQKDLVVLHNRSVDDFRFNMSLNALFSEQDYEMEAISEPELSRGNQEKLTIKRSGSTTTYELRRDAEDSDNVFEMPEDARKITLTKTENGEDEPSYTLVEGFIAHAMTGIAGAVTSVAGGIRLPKIKFERR